MLAIRRGVLGSGLTFLVNLLLLPFVLSHIGARTYGTWLVFASALAVGALADAGVRTEVSRRSAAANSQGDEVALDRLAHEGMTMLLVVVTPVVLASVLASGPLASFLFPVPPPGYSTVYLANVFRLLLVAMGINIVLGGYFAVLRGLQRSDIENVARMAAGPVNAAVTLLGVALGWTLWALVAGYLAGLVMTTAVQAVGLRRLAPYVHPGLTRIPWKLMGGYLGLSGLALLSQVSDVVDAQWDKIVLSHFVDPDAVTYFHIGTSLLLQAKVIAVLPIAPLLVAVAEVRGQGAERAVAVQRTLTKLGMVATAVILGAAFVFAPAFIRLWLGAGYQSAVSVAQLFTIAVLLNLISAPTGLQAFAERQHTLPAASAAINMVVNAAVSLVLTREIGLYGAVYGSIAGNLAGTALIFSWAPSRLSRFHLPPFAALLLSLVVTTVLSVTGVANHLSWAGLIGSFPLFVVAMGFACLYVERLQISDVRGALG